MTKIEDFPESTFGFVYCITNLLSGRMYIGRKYLYRTITRPPLKGKKRKRKEKVQSDWKDYTGSSKELNEDISSLGEDMFRREIIYLCKTKGEAAYLEAETQFRLKVLQNPDLYYNGIINCRLHRRSVPSKLAEKSPLLFERDVVE